MKQCIQREIKIHSHETAVYRHYVADLLRWSLRYGQWLSNHYWKMADSTPRGWLGHLEGKSGQEKKKLWKLSELPTLKVVCNFEVKRWRV